MGIQRSFTAMCDKCGHHAHYNRYSSATNLREACKGNLWTISGNKFTCPTCNKRFPQYLQQNGERNEGN